jgi:hypothetical protein
MGDVIQSLWIGDSLSVMEQLCISSFLRMGHEFHLYVYQETSGIPDGTVVLDGRKVLPAARIFTYKEHKTYAGFANFFRYRLLLENGGWFVDADTICVKAFDFPEEYVFSSEGINGNDWVNLAAIKVPAGSAIMRQAWETCEKMDTSELKWSQCGPTLMKALVAEHSLQPYVQPPAVFCPLHFSEWERMLDPEKPGKFDESTHAVHLWNELWRRSSQDKNASYPPECLYEHLKRDYL